MVRIDSHIFSSLLFKRAVVTILFVLASFVLTKVTIAPVIGQERYTLSLYQAIAPVFGAFVGAWLGVGAILFVNVVNLVLSQSYTLFDIARVFTLAAAAYYFATSQREVLTILIPLGAIALFVVHPVGAEVWWFALFWTIPLLALLWKENIVAKSVGATFVAHSIGSVAYLYTFPTTPSFWAALVPIVVVERTLFVIGIIISYFTLGRALSVFALTRELVQRTHATDKR